MKFLGPKPVLKLLFCAVLMSVVFAVPAHTQWYSASGTFNLPFDAQWGQVKLSAGTYSFVVDDALHNNRIILRQGTHYMGFISRSEFSDDNKANLQPALLCVRHDSSFTVRALRLPEIGTYYYFMSKQKNQTVAQKPELIQDVPVLLGGK